MSIKNAEIKARCDDPARIRQILQDQGARKIGIDHQTDTYFVVASGRLKLRQGNIENSLIYYQRPDQAAPKVSDVQLFKTTNAEELFPVLDAALSTLVVVDKRREIHFIDHVKFHIDEVRGLGSYVEIEVIDEHGEMAPEDMHTQCEHYMMLLGIQAADLVKQSYSDMLLQKQDDDAIPG